MVFVLPSCSWWKYFHQVQKKWVWCQFSNVLECSLYYFKEKKLFWLLGIILHKIFHSYWWVCVCVCVCVLGRKLENVISSRLFPKKKNILFEEKKQELLRIKIKTFLAIHQKLLWQENLVFKCLLIFPKPAKQKAVHLLNLSEASGTPSSVGLVLAVSNKQYRTVDNSADLNHLGTWKGLT